MDPQKFGSFISQLRKEQNMTQRDLARKLQVTDKAVSRWERGLGFPDINTLEPLAQALGITVLELMQSRRQEEPVSKEEASRALTDTVEVARRQWHRWLKKGAKAVCCVLALVCLWWVATGLLPVSSVFVGDYSVMEDAQVLTIKVGVSTPMGYIRDCRVISEGNGTTRLRFYAAFGGLNSNFGARNVFVIPLEEGCRQICLEDGRVLLQKNEATGQWERP